MQSLFFRKQQLVQVHLSTANGTVTLAALPNVFLLPHIGSATEETRDAMGFRALDNLDAILSVEGLDAVYIGPSDLSLALGCKPSMDDLEPKAQQAVEHILARARHHGVVAGIHNAGPASALRRIAMGFQFVTVSSDARLIAEGSQQIMAAMRAGQAAKPSSGY